MDGTAGVDAGLDFVNVGVDEGDGGSGQGVPNGLFPVIIELAEANFKRSVPFRPFQQGIAAFGDAHGVSDAAGIEHDARRYRAQALAMRVGVAYRVVAPSLRGLKKRFKQRGVALNGDELLHQGATMEQSDAAAAEAKLIFHGQAAEPLHAFGAELLPVIGIGRKLFFSHAKVPVAAQHDLAVRHGPVKGEVVAGALAHDIAQAQHAVRVNQPEVAFEREGGGAVSMKVRDQGDAHGACLLQRFLSEVYQKQLLLARRIAKRSAACYNGCIRKGGQGMRFFRALALSLSLVLLAVPALSEETFATCQIPQGAESLFVTEAGAFEAPDGLEGMYALMLDANSLSDVYLTRMRYGRALASISCTSGVEPGTAQELLSLWPDVAARIAQEALYVNDDPSCAQVDTVFGYEAMVISTDIAVGEQSMTLLDAWCVAFYNGPDLIEVWTVYPSAPAYLYDGEAAQELESDRADLEAFIASLSFPPYDTQEE